MRGTTPSTLPPKTSLMPWVYVALPHTTHLLMVSSKLHWIPRLDGPSGVHAGLSVAHAIAGQDEDLRQEYYSTIPGSVRPQEVIHVFVPWNRILPSEEQHEHCSSHASRHRCRNVHVVVEFVVVVVVVVVVSACCVVTVLMLVCSMCLLFPIPTNPPRTSRLRSLHPAQPRYLHCAVVHVAAVVSLIRLRFCSVAIVVFVTVIVVVVVAVVVSFCGHWPPANHCLSLGLPLWPPLDNIDTLNGEHGHSHCTVVHNIGTRSPRNCPGMQRMLLSVCRCRLFGLCLVLLIACVSPLLACTLASLSNVPLSSSSSCDSVSTWNTLYLLCNVMGCPRLVPVSRSQSSAVFVVCIAIPSPSFFLFTALTPSLKHHRDIHANTGHPPVTPPIVVFTAPAIVWVVAPRVLIIVVEIVQSFTNNFTR